MHIRVESNVTHVPIKNPEIFIQNFVRTNVEWYENLNYNIVISYNAKKQLGINIFLMKKE